MPPSTNQGSQERASPCIVGAQDGGNGHPRWWRRPYDWLSSFMMVEREYHRVTINIPWAYSLVVLNYQMTSCFVPDHSMVLVISIHLF